MQPHIFGRPQTELPRHRITRFAAGLIAIFAAEIVLILAVFLPYSRLESQELWQKRLSALSYDRSVLIQTWVEDCIANTDLLASYPSLMKAASEAHTLQDGTKAHAFEVLASMMELNHFEAVSVHDADGHVVMKRVIAGANVASDRLQELTSGAGDPKNRVAFIRLDDGKPALVFSAPMIDRAAGGRKIGSILVMADPYRWLYPTLKRQPDRNDTTECILVQRDGDAALFLSPLRYSSAPPLTIRHPISDSHTAAAAALRKRASFGRFVDYRGVPVIAATQWIGATPWALVSKADEREVFASSLDETAVAMAVTALITLIAAAAVSATLRSRRLKHMADLAHAEERFADVFEHANDAIIVSDESGHLVAANQKAETLYGYSRGELLTMSVHDIRTAESRDRIAEHQSIVRQEKGTTFETTHLTRTGARIEVEVSSRLLVIDSAEFYVSVVRDISARKAADENVRRLAAAVEQTGESIVITDVEGRIQYVNPAFTRISGYTQEEVEGRTSALLRSGKHDAEFYRSLWQTILAGNLWTGHFTNRRKDGSLFEEEVTISPIRNARGEIVNFVAVKRDVTHEIAMERQLQQSQKMEAIGNLAGGLAHDFNNILQVFSSQLHILRRRYAGSDVEKAATTLSEQVKRGAALTRKLLMVSRRDAAKVETFDISELLLSTSKMLHPLVRENIRFETRFDSEPLHIRADRAEIEQVFMNLVVNAVDAMPNGGQLIVTTRRSGENCVLEVRDTGTGIPAEIRDRIFEPFFTTKPVGKGTGLGLAVVHGIIGRSGGTIRIGSPDEGTGSVFTVTLPRVPPRPAALEPQPAEMPLGNGEKVLLVEDNDEVRTAIREMLIEARFDVVDVSTAEGVDDLPPDGAPPVLLLSDVMLPGAGGPELAKRLIRRWPGLRLILMSGYTDQQIIPEMIDGQRVILLRKPFGISQLLDTIRAVMHG